ncbi:Alpha/Beta hydrolase protein [Phaeosphaeriaceae sp. PMI808]|nr:Alpha/Beta hydrolase protein [Phaeosphaeriaceae sp. PMI808]
MAANAVLVPLFDLRDDALDEETGAPGISSKSTRQLQKDTASSPFYSSLSLVVFVVFIVFISKTHFPNTHPTIMAVLISIGLLFTVVLSLLTGSGAVPTTGKSKPALIFVPAAFSKPAVYDIVKSRLFEFGYSATAVDLPSVSKVGRPVNRHPDIKSVQQSISKNIEQGRDVILVGNSYGATVICDAVKDFTTTSKGKGKVVGLIFLAGFLPFINEPSGSRPDIRQISPSWFRFEGTQRVYWDNDLVNFPPSYTLFNLLGKAQADKWTSKLEPSSFAALNATAQYIPYDGKIRSLYVIGQQDNAVPLTLANSYIDQPGAKMERLSIDADHLPMLSRPDAVVELIRRFAGETV